MKKKNREIVNIFRTAIKNGGRRTEKKFKILEIKVPKNSFLKKIPRIS